MFEYAQIARFYSKIIGGISKGNILAMDSLAKIALFAGFPDFSYIDNRRGAKELGYDIWENISDTGTINDRLKYSKSEQFPDFLFRIALGNRLHGGFLLELKDSKSGSIASFNSTLPTKSKTLLEIDRINGTDLVSRMAKLIDNCATIECLNLERRCFYLVRTFNNRPDQTKISIVDGAFFETVPKEHLVYEMLMNIIEEHRKQHNQKMACGKQKMRRIHD